MALVNFNYKNPIARKNTLSLPQTLKVSPRRWFWASCYFSLILHLFVVSGLWLYSLFVSPAKTNQTPSTHPISISRSPITVQILKSIVKEKEKLVEKAQKISKNKTLIIENHAAPTLQEPKKSAFLSDQNRRTKVETIAPNTGVFQPQLNVPGPEKKIHSQDKQKPLSDKQQNSDLRHKASESSENKESVNETTDNPSTLSITDKGDFKIEVANEQAVKKLESFFEPETEPLKFQPGSGSLGNLDYLKNVKIKSGDLTQLNSSQYQYYGFFTRFKIQLYQRWISLIPNQMQKLAHKGRDIAQKTEKIAVVFFVLDNLGQITSTKLIKSSGFEELDQAALSALKEAGPFPNPPDGIMNDQNEFSTEWSFIYET